MGVHEITLRFDPLAVAMEYLRQHHGYGDGDGEWPAGKPERKQPTLSSHALLRATKDLRAKYHLKRVSKSQNPIPGVEKFTTHPRGLTDTQEALAALKEIPGIEDVAVDEIAALPAAGYLRFQFSKTPDLTASFNSLPDDGYAKQALRQRRFSQFRAMHTDKGWRLTTLPHKPFVQSAEDNPLSGGIARHFEPLKCDVDPLLKDMLEQIGAKEANALHLDVHQYRVFTQDDQARSPVPEGPHQDGHTIVGIMVVNRHNVTGGETTLTDLHRKEVLKTTLEEAEGFFFQDPRFYHDASQITASAEGSGYRDVFVINVNHWNERRYGHEFAARSGVDRQAYDALA